MRKFGIRYQNGDVVGFYKVEQFKDLDEAHKVVIENNYYEVKYPELIRITSLQFFTIN